MFQLQFNIAKMVFEKLQIKIMKKIPAKQQNTKDVPQKP
jgi:hypothetical protein